MPFVAIGVIGVCFPHTNVTALLLFCQRGLFGAASQKAAKKNQIKDFYRRQQRQQRLAILFGKALVIFASFCWYLAACANPSECAVLGRSLPNQRREFH